MTTTDAPVSEAAARRFLACGRIAVVGASPERGNFGGAIARDLRDRGVPVVAVHPDARAIDGIPAYPDLASVEGDVDGALVMVPAAAAGDVARQCVARGVEHVWLFRGLGGTGSVSADAVAVCRDAGVDLVAGACPLMFLEPVGWGHRVHRAIRRRRHAVVRDGR